MQEINDIYLKCTECKWDFKQYPEHNGLCKACLKQKDFEEKNKEFISVYKDIKSLIIPGIVIGIIVFIVNSYSNDKDTTKAKVKIKASYISEATFDGHWPFYSSSGILECSGGAVLFNGKAVNGTARNAGYPLINGNPPWGDIIDEGLNLCK